MSVECFFLISDKISNNLCLAFPNKSDDTTVKPNPKQCEGKIDEMNGKKFITKIYFVVQL